MKTIFSRLKSCEQKIDAICKHYNITLDEQPKFKVTEKKDTQIGFRLGEEKK